MLNSTYCQKRQKTVTDIYIREANNTYSRCRSGRFSRELLSCQWRELRSVEPGCLQPWLRPRRTPAGRSLRRTISCWLCFTRSDLYQTLWWWQHEQHTMLPITTNWCPTPLYNLSYCMSWLVAILAPRKSFDILALYKLDYYYYYYYYYYYNSVSIIHPARLLQYTM